MAESGDREGLVLEQCCDTKRGNNEHNKPRPLQVHSSQNDLYDVPQNM